MMILKNLVKNMTKSKVVFGLARGVGGAFLAGIGWKLGSDVYDLVKRRLQDKKPEAVIDESEERGLGSE